MGFIKRLIERKREREYQRFEADIREVGRIIAEKEEELAEAEKRQEQASDQ